MSLSFTFVLTCLASVAAAQPGTDRPIVQVEIVSPATGMVVAAGSTIGWTLRVMVSMGDNLGLAGFSADLIQSATNPAPIVFAPSLSVPAALSGFSRPNGVSNAGVGGFGTGFGGTQVGDGINQRLAQVGGLQNTFGVAAGSIGLDTSIDSGIGQGALPQTIATGTFFAPSLAGSYRVSVRNAVATVLQVVNSAPTPSRCGSARAIVLSDVLFTVRCLTDIDDGSGTGVPDGGVTIDDLLYYLRLFEDGDVAADVDDGSGTGSPDGGVTIDDLLYFLARFEVGC